MNSDDYKRDEIRQYYVKRNETPVLLNPIKISNSYLISKYELTQKQWLAIMDTNKSRNKGDNYPIEGISWNDSQKYIRKLKKRTGFKFRLPTNGEWTYAALAGTILDRYYWGNDWDGFLPMKCTWNKANSGNKIKKIGLKLPNQWGLYDILGNSNEWVNDWFSKNYGFRHKYKNIDPIGPDKGETKMARGGNFHTDVHIQDIAQSIYDYPPDRATGYISFRLVLQCNDLFYDEKNRTEEVKVK